MKTLLFFLIFTLTFIDLYSQDSTRIAVEINRAEAVRNSNPDSTFIYAENILKWAGQNQNNYQIGRGNALKGVSFHIKAQPDSAMKYYFRAIEYYKKGGIQHEHQVANINIGIIYESRGDFENALKHQMEAYQFFTKSGNIKFLTNSMRGIARVLSLSGKHPEALPYFHKIYDNFKSTGDSANMAHALNDLGSIYIYLKDYEKGAAYKKEALPFFERANHQEALGTIYQALGNIDKFQGRFSTSRQFYQKALDCYQKINLEKGFGETYFNLGNLEDTLNRNNEAIEYYRKSIEANKAFGNVQIESAALAKLSAAYARVGDFRKAYESHLAYSDLSQKMLDQEKQRNMVEMETRFQTIQKDKEIEVQKNLLAQKEYQLLRNKQYLYATLSFLLIGILLFLFWRSRVKIGELKLKEAHMHEIQQQRMMAIIDSQEKERKRFTSDLHDSFGQLISVLKINISELADAASSQSFSRMEKFQECKAVINDMYTELRNVVFDLMPQTLVNGGIKPALTEFADRLNRSGRIVAEVIVFGLENRLSQETETALYRICQEWVNNILKYSEATKITIQLTADESELTLTIEDDGMGFDKNILKNSSGNGWKNINSRAGVVGGKLELETNEGIKGNLLILNIPQEMSARQDQKIPA